MESEVYEYLKKENIKFREFKHEAVFTVAESENKIAGSVPGMHTKNLFLEDEHKKSYLVCMDAFLRLNLKKLEKHLGVKKLRFGSSEKLLEELKVTPGSVSIFGLINSNKTRLILDEQVWKAQEVGFHPNVNTTTLVLSHEEFEKFYNSLKCSKEVFTLA